jgi:acyl carrier protein
MTREDVFAKLQDVFRTEFHQPDLQLKESMKAGDIEGWDSHRQISIILACEETFGVTLKTREINAMENIGEMADHLHKRLAKG